MDKPVEIANKDEIAECARLLAMNVAHYEMRYGALPLEEQLAVSSKLNDDHTELLSRGMKTMAGVLGDLIRGKDDSLDD